MKFRYADKQVEIPFEFKTQPYEHQRKVVADTALSPYWAYFLEMGCGKSKILLDKVSVLASINKIKAAVIIAPKGVYSNWVNKEIPQHFQTSSKYHAGPYVILKWGDKSRAFKEIWKEVLDPKFNPKSFIFFVINIEALSSKSGVQALNDFLSKFAPECLICCDESTVIKNPKAKRTVAAVKAAHRCFYRAILTGSPVTKSPLDLYAQCAFLKQGILGHTSFYTFRNEYAIMKDQVNPYNGATYKQIIGYRNEDKLRDILKKFSTRITKQECLDLPEKIYTTREVEMTPEQKAYYDAIKKENLALLENGDQISAQIAITRLLRMHQIVCGCTKTDSGEEIIIKNNRVAELMDILAETSGKVIIWANYRANIKEILEAIKKEYGEKSVVSYFGDTSTADRELAVKRMQEDPECRFFVGNTQTGGYGITLTAATTTIYYSNNYDLEKRLQSEDRNHRIGQNSNVHYIDIITPGTVDLKILKALKAKMNIADTILDDDPKEWLL